MEYERHFLRIHEKILKFPYIRQFLFIAGTLLINISIFQK